MTARELAEWMAYERVEPFGHTRDNYHMATLASLTYNINRGKDAKAAAPQDFMWAVTVPSDEARAERQRQRKLWADIRGHFKSLAEINKHGIDTG